MAKRVDSNQPEIVRALRQAGLHVVHLHTLGKGVPDLLVTGYHRALGLTLALLVEIKAGQGELTVDETKWHGEYPNDGPLMVARSAEDVLHWFEIA